ncbi:MAG: hypothetical protein J7639_05890 [Paenibacillaceae bacterium]|nr:hypothetical protein [Paenibacillaceae bacterium]
MMRFDRYIGIDYSGRGLPHERTAGIQVAEVDREGRFRRIAPADSRAATFNWSRSELFLYMRETLTARGGDRVIIGIDHNLSVPRSYFERHGLRDWDEFLRHFQALWNTKTMSVASCREQVAPYENPGELRVTETYTSSAKSAFNFEQKTGAVSYSTHAGLPWIYELRSAARERLHVWPYDGWEPAPDAGVLAEVYPALLYQRYKRRGDFPRDWPRDAQDALAIALWLNERDGNGTLDRYLQMNTLTEDEKQIAAQQEGWILGVC